MFSLFAKKMSQVLGSSKAFLLAFLFILIWIISGPYFQFSNTWQLVINTATTISTFLMVFLLQNTQNRDTVAVHLKLDELIRAMKNTHNELLKAEELSEEELATLLQRYEKLAKDVKEQVNKGKGDVGTPEIPNS